MIIIHLSDQMYHTTKKARGGSVKARWIFSFDSLLDRQHDRFGTLTSFSEDTLSPGASLPLHPYNDNEVVTYIADGEFRHLDNKGHNGTLKKGWVQHTTAGPGMWHSEINNLEDRPLRFVQMQFSPAHIALKPHYEQKPVQKRQRRNKLLALVSNRRLGALKINADTEVFSSFLEKGKELHHAVEKDRGIFIYVLEKGPVRINGIRMTSLSCAEIVDEPAAVIRADEDAELLLVDVRL
ncbi:MAG: pirin family protein [Deltaproteobacteria bacterium]